MNIGRIASIAFLALSFSAATFADSDTRPMTPLEKRFLTEAFQACEKAVSGIQSTWDEERDDSNEPGDRIATDSDNSPLVYYDNFHWVDNVRIVEARRKADTELEELTPTLQANVASTDTKAYEELAEKIGKAAEAGNMAEVARLQKNLEALAEKIEQGAQPLDQAINRTVEQNLPHDVEVTVRIAINKFYDSFGQAPQTGKLVDGTPFYRVEDGRITNGNWEEGTTFVYLGNDWKVSIDNGVSIMQHPEHADRPSASVRSVVVAVQADSKRALDTLNNMDLTALKKLLKS